MISIEKLWQYYKNDRVFITAHAAESCRQRGITSLDIRIPSHDKWEQDFKTRRGATK